MWCLASGKELRAAPGFLPLSPSGAEPHAAAHSARQNQNCRFVPKDQPRNANVLPRPGGAATGTDTTFTWDALAQRPGLRFNPKSAGSHQLPWKHGNHCKVLHSHRGWHDSSSTGHRPSSPAPTVIYELRGLAAAAPPSSPPANKLCQWAQHRRPCGVPRAQRQPPGAPLHPRHVHTSLPPPSSASCKVCPCYHAKDRAIFTSQGLAC
ncbi:PREDICTED: uncharacterized protein LOC104284836 [Charadrius vociferus]|uniref:uncharacterized protein LOC104284836 n=1 Tax=Charadrius vociferus TaxID=50402 RepID=UPI00052186C3|nr:PREDICTED: uncharacterized protein LOC104284836 [Charadrius vociferus]